MLRYGQRYWQLKDILSRLLAEKIRRHKQLEMIAQNRSTKNVSSRQVMSTVRIRDPFISEYARARASGVCQLCETNAPFEDRNGRPYLESHHIDWLVNGGEDSVENTVALCPNCHRKMHVLNDHKDVEKIKLKLFRS